MLHTVCIVLKNHVTPFLVYLLDVSFLASRFWNWISIFKSIESIGMSHYCHLKEKKFFPGSWTKYQVQPDCTESPESPSRSITIKFSIRWNSGFGWSKSWMKYPLCWSMRYYWVWPGWMYWRSLFFSLLGTKENYVQSTLTIALEIHVAMKTA